ncbi:acetolactate synthase/ large subunit/ biosynthetic type [Synechococcus sp. PROS-9-1]|uniref:thiamine pyrophosphate-binding protein n=1 Tax=Synechococcus sp. PROS-9-1 TaxID=1968775 RepID=UPI001648CD11|nr:thiamine pyrophosphate-binding protein [Synechococcus sp. PROS-9-1]QNJ30608.1 acetolactate synthase/ large subunit/ biosynthetic type [Synechococcus sp. PROS-9-1]
MVVKKLSDLVADFLSEKSVRHVFAISGGASLHLIHSVANHPSIDYICNHHEQASAMAADAYSRITGNLGVAIATSGPGATNLITGLCCSYYDSVPVLAITGQVNTTRMVGNTGVRQVGFQETPIVSICAPITKYAVQISDPLDILYELEKCFFIATSGRPGPVLVDIPDDFQRVLVDRSKCRKFLPDTDIVPTIYPNLNDSSAYIISQLNISERPIIIAGWGVHLSGFKNQLLEFAENFSIPIALTWGAADLISASHPLFVGTFGTHGNRHANFAVQNADLIISFGSRLDTKSTGSPVNTFARQAKKIVVDVDPSELSKFSHFGLKIDSLILQDLKFANLKPLIHRAKEFSFASKLPWLDQIKDWKSLFTLMDDNARKSICTEKVNPYVVFDLLSQSICTETNLIFDTGCALAWGMQSYLPNHLTRIFHDFNNTAMGWSLPAAIASALATPCRDTICLIGDGSFMMSLHELAVIKRYKLPIKIFLFNNSGYGMIQQTQDQWLDSDYVASSYEGGLDFPDFRSLANSFSLKYAEVASNDSIESCVSNVLKESMPILCNFIVSDKMRVIPQVKAGYPNEDLEPLLAREVFYDQMIIPPFSPDSQRPLNYQA